MPLSNVALGAPHVAAHNAERAAINALEVDLADMQLEVDQIPDTVADLVPGEVAAAVAGHVPGSRMGYAESAVAFGTTNVAPTLAIISALTQVVTGTGRSVEIKVHLPRCYHTVANTGIIAGLFAIQTGFAGAYIDTIIGRTPSTTNADGCPIDLYAELTLGDGEEWTFAAYIAGLAAGTTGIAGGATIKQRLSVISR